MNKGVNAQQLTEWVIQPTLHYLGSFKPGLDSPAAVELLLGTARQESQLRYIVQLGSGPARGLWQVEPDTAKDIWENYLKYHQGLHTAVRGLLGAVPSSTSQLATNLAYSCAMARLVYYRRPEPLPAQGDLEAQAHYWKKHYNTHLGAGRVEDYINANKGEYPWPD